MLNIGGSGNHITVSDAVYDDTHELVAHTLVRLSIETTFIDATI